MSTEETEDRLVEPVVKQRGTSLTAIARKVLTGEIDEFSIRRNRSTGEVSVRVTVRDIQLTHALSPSDALPMQEHTLLCSMAEAVKKCLSAYRHRPK